MIGAVWPSPSAMLEKEKAKIVAFDVKTKNKSDLKYIIYLYNLFYVF